MKGPSSSYCEAMVREVVGTVDEPIEPGMTVVSSDRREIGRVKRSAPTAIPVDRQMRPDLWVPLTSVERIMDPCVVLDLPFLKVDAAASLLLEHWATCNGPIAARLHASRGNQIGSTRCSGQQRGWRVERDNGCCRVAAHAHNPHSPEVARPGTHLDSEWQ
jgi:hypothetical protein